MSFTIYLFLALLLRLAVPLLSPSLIAILKRRVEINTPVTSYLGCISFKVFDKVSPTDASRDEKYKRVSISLQRVYHRMLPMWPITYLHSLAQS